MTYKFHTDTYIINGIEFSPDEHKVVLPHTEEMIKLRPREALVFTHLIEAYPSSFSRQEMAEKIWKDTYVTQTTINQTIKSLRDHINDKDKSVIVTVPQKGYRLGYQPVLTVYEEQIVEQVDTQVEAESLTVTKKQLTLVALLQVVIFIVAFVGFSLTPVNDHVKIDNVNFLFTPTKVEQARFVGQFKNKIFVTRYQNYYSVCSVKKKVGMECQKVAR